MAKYRKKPVVIEAFKWTSGPDQTEDPVWIVEAMKKATGVGSVRILGGGATGVPLRMIIETLEGPIRADVGDYIIRGIEGEIYPCKPGIFEKTYEVVPEPKVGTGSDIHSDPACIFTYCPHPSECKAGPGTCINPRITSLGDPH